MRAAIYGGGSLTLPDHLIDSAFNTSSANSIPGEPGSSENWNYGAESAGPQDGPVCAVGGNRLRRDEPRLPGARSEVEARGSDQSADDQQRARRHGAAFSARDQNCDASEAPKYPADPGIRVGRRCAISGDAARAARHAARRAPDIPGADTRTGNPDRRADRDGVGLCPQAARHSPRCQAAQYHGDGRWAVCAGRLRHGEAGRGGDTADLHGDYPWLPRVYESRAGVGRDNQPPHGYLLTG